MGLVKSIILIVLSILSFFFLSSILNTAYAGNIFYSIQLYTFKEQNHAQEKVDSLKNLGHNAFYRSETLKGEEKVFKVYIERYGSKGEAENEAEILKKLDLISEYTISALEEKPQADPRDGKHVTKGYYLQVGSYKEKANAEKLAANLKASGQNAIYRYETVKGKGKFYRVYIDGFSSKGEALKKAKALKKSGIISGYSVMAMGEQPRTVSPGKKQDGKVYFLHVSSFKEKINAEKTVDRLKKNGHKAFIVSETISGESWFRVYIGEFDDEKSARRIGSELKGKGTISYFKPLEINEDIMRD
ncbi:MAG: SPOR domain-containing protein [Deltaproteobacteria bacterium]|nr:SPOR domain-containing protein [Deltaproteobacteria bacterium]